MTSFLSLKFKILNWIDHEGMPFLQSHIDIGDSIGHVTSLQADFLNFETSAEVIKCIQ